MRSGRIRPAGSSGSGAPAAVQIDVWTKMSVEAPRIGDEMTDLGIRSRSSSQLSIDDHRPRSALADPTNESLKMDSLSRDCVTDDPQAPAGLQGVQNNNNNNHHHHEQHQNFTSSRRSLHCAMRPVINLAQFFAVFPIIGVNYPDASHLQFTWQSSKILYCFLSAFGSFTITAFSIYHLFITNLSAVTTSNLVFFFTVGISTILFLKLARHWPSFALAWESMEQELARRQPLASSRLNLSLKFLILTTVVMVFALVEHTLSILSGYVTAKECSIVRQEPDVLRTYFELQFPQIFSNSNFVLWKGVLVQFFNILCTFSWNFMDLFLILISVALTDQFRQLNNRLYMIRNKDYFTVKDMPEWWWAQARVDYNRLATMTREADEKISDIVLLSFSTNLYFICIQLLNSFKPLKDAIQTIYFCFSFGFLLARTAAVSLYAAAVHDESHLPAPILYSVCSANYSTEIRRFLVQVSTDTISLTGMKFFSITRSLILTVAGTIVTYELVLVQFNAVQSERSQTDNVTKICQIR